MNSKNKVKNIVTVIALLVVGGMGICFAAWHHEIGSVISFHEIRARDDEHSDGAVYEMTVKGDYYLEDFIKQGGVSNDSELIDFVVGHMTKGIIPVKIENPEIGCSSFTAKTADEKKLFARNYDMKKTNICIVHTDAGKGRHKTISTVDLGLIGMDADSNVEGLMNKITCLAAVYAPLDGMNDAGVSCGIYMTYQGGEETVATDQNTDKPDITSTTFLRMVLDYADNLDEAVEIAKAYDMHDSACTSYHYMVADASGRSAIFEWVGETDKTDDDGSARTLVITYHDDDDEVGEAEGASDYQWVTNFIIKPRYYETSSDMKGLDRYRKLEELLLATEGIVQDERSAMQILAAVGRRSWNNDDKNTITVHSVIYNLTDVSAYWVPNENYHDENAWLHFEL